MSEISVLMGTYNDNRSYTALAIDSILNQTVTDFELIICDDGSDAAFFTWLLEYCKKDTRIRLLRNRKNRGLAAVLNRCLRYAAGRYVARMDADDRSERNRLERQVAFLKAHPEYAFVGCNARLIAKQGVWGERRLERVPQKESFLNTSPFIHPAVMFRREVLKGCGGYCESRRVLRAEDYELFMRLYASGQRGYNIQEMLLDYREDDRSYAKRKYRYRLLECGVRFQGFSRLGIVKGNLRYVGKPLLAGMIPYRIMKRMRTRRYAVRR